MSRDFCENFQKSVKPRADRNKKASKKGVFDPCAASQVAETAARNRNFRTDRAIAAKIIFERTGRPRRIGPQAQKPLHGNFRTDRAIASKIILKRTEKVSIKSRSSGIAEPGSERTRRGAQGFRIRPKTDCKHKPGADGGKQKREKNKCGTAPGRAMRNKNAKAAARGCETETQKRPRAAAFVMLLFCLRPRSPLFCPSLRGGDRRRSRRSSNGSACFLRTR